MPLSSMTAFPFIPEGSEATPGLWNTPLSIISANIAELNTKAIGLASGLVLNGAGDPNSQITAPVGFLYEQIDSTASVHPVWVKKIGSGNTGWASDAGFMGDAGDGQGAIQVGQNASAQAINTLALGASSFVGPNANQGIAEGFGSTVTGSGAVGVGANTQVYSPNGVGVGINAYVGFRDAGAFGSNVTSNATGAFSFGAGAANSGLSSFFFSTKANSASTASSFIVDTDVLYSAPDTRLIGTNPIIRVWDSAATADNRMWDIFGNGGFNQLQFRTVNDSLTTAAAWMTVTRSLWTATTVAINNKATFDLSAATLSLSTYATALAVPSGGFGIVMRASGLSIVFKSGSTVYVLAASTTSGTA